jgi:hypothetical protein
MDSLYERLLAIQAEDKLPSKETFARVISHIKNLQDTVEDLCKQIENLDDYCHILENKINNMRDTYE